MLANCLLISACSANRLRLNEGVTFRPKFKMINSFIATGKREKTRKKREITIQYPSYAKIGQIGAIRHQIMDAAYFCSNQPFYL